MRRNKKYNLEEVKQYFMEQGCELLANEYNGCKEKLLYKCRCGNISKINFGDFKFGRRCKKCAFTNRPSRHNFEYVKKLFYQGGCELLEYNYKNNTTRMKYRCSCGNISFTTFARFQLGRRCDKCGIKKMSNSLKHSFEFVKQYFTHCGCELLEDHYEFAITPMWYRCKCGNVAKIQFCRFQRGGRCMKCSRIRRKDRDQYKLERMFHGRYCTMLRSMLKRTGRNKTDKKEKILGYGYKDLKQYIEGHPNWDVLKNRKWHIDHIFPAKAFFEHGIFDMKLINCLDNLQPLDAHDNHVKSAKYNKEEFEIKFFLLINHLPKRNKALQ